MADLSTEGSKLHSAMQRLGTLRNRHLKLADVYGSAAQTPELQATLQRWMAQRENSAQVQIAIIPQPVFSTDEMISAILEGREPGMLPKVDIDSYG